jgi:ABC-type dipeptide/oligopeptide/nickel transport system permease subunit
MASPEGPVDRFRRLARSEDQAPVMDWWGDTNLNSLPMEAPLQAEKARREWQVAWRPIALAAGRRLLVGFVTAVVIIFLTYLGLRMAQGEEFFNAVSRALSQTPQYLGMLAKGDLGVTGEYGFSGLPLPVKEILPRIFINSLGLLASGLSIATLFGIPLGFLAAASRRRIWSIPALILSIIGISIPSFLAALVLQLLVIRITQLTGSTFLPVGGFGWDEHLILPALVLAARPFAQITRVSFITFREILDQEYIRTARSKGLFRWWILLRHVWPNALIPILTTLGIAMRFSLISLPIIEFFFGWEGVGFYLLKAISTQEYSFAIAMLLSLSLAFILVNAILEVSYRVIDPRLRESKEQSAAIELDSVFELIKNTPQTILQGVKNLPLIGNLFPLKPEQVIKPLTAEFEEIHQERVEEQGQANASRQAWSRGTLHNPALLIGILLVLGLVIVTIFGVQIAPQSPYTTRGLTITDGEFKVPPFPPDETFLLGTDLLGRDILSMILAGAQQTFVLVVLVVLGRILVGFILGAISGWIHGGWLDRLIMGWVEVLASFPALLFAMVLILALDIRKGLFPFFFALTFIGWGEITQFIRAEVMRIKSMAFIESAIASGSTVARVLSRHVQPNLIPALISLTALEMGAVLMILGELGFVGIFIGGGIFAELEWMAPLFHYSDVPEWGALLGNLRTYARGYPWMAIYPSIAFFIAILAFNLFGEGIKTLIEFVGVRVTRWFNRYSFAGLILVIAVILSIKGSTGALASYRKQAENFDGSKVSKYYEALTAPAVEERALGSIGLQTAAVWIADSFRGLGLQPAGETFTYFQHRERAFERLTGIPVLAFDIDIPELVFHRDYNVFPSIHTISGSVYAPVRFLALGKVGSYERLGYRYYELEDIDYSDEILLVLPEDMFYVDQIPHAGALVVASHPELLQSNYTLSPHDGFGREAPTLWISEGVANRLLAAHGVDVSDLYDVYADLREDDIYELELDIQAAIQIQGEPIEADVVKHVIGHWQGFVSNQFEGIDDELFIVLAKYDCPPFDPYGGPAQCEKNTAAGLAVMLETIRAMREAEYQPYRTFIFIAYSGEGFEGGGRFQVENVDKFLEAKFGFSSAYELLGVIELGPLGPGSENGVIVTSDGSLRLTQLFAKAVGEQGLSVERVGADLDLERIFETGSTIESGSKTPWIEISGMQLDQELDELEASDQEYLEQIGRALTQTLMVLGRELDY